MVHVSTNSRPADQVLCRPCRRLVHSLACEIGASGPALRALGVTPSELLAVIERQGPRCAVCRRTAAETLEKKLFADHDHATGRFRGLLCNHCNAGLGFFREDPELLTAAIGYIQSSSHGVSVVHNIQA